VSLRARLLAGMVVVAAVLGVAAVAITRTTERHLIDRVDDQLRAAGAPGPIGRFDPRGPGLGPERLSSLYAAHVARTGAVRTIFTPNLTGEDLPLPVLDPEMADAAAATGAAFTVDAEGDELRYRAVARAERRLGGVLVLALPLDDVDAAVDRLVAVEIVATLVVLAVLALVTWWVLRLGVRPIKQMTATAGAIAAGDLSHRVPDVTPGTEAAELGAALNTMLGSIEEAFDQRTASEERLRRFVADASHELRTPITTIRGYAELYRAGGLGDGDELQEAMRRTEQEAVRMGTLVDDLLHLARLDQGRPLERGPVDLTVIAEDAGRDARAVDPGRAVTVTTDGALVVDGDESRLRQVVANLVGNALVHTTPGSPIEIRTFRRDGTGVVEIADRGPGMDDDAATRAFERFFRADPARSRHRGGSGLGLAIVDATVRAHGGTVTLTSSPERGTTVRVELPISP